MPDSLRRLGANLIAALGQRIELAGLELRAAEQRAFWRGVAALFAATVGMLSFVCLTFGIVLVVWPDSFPLALIWIGIGFFIVGAVIGLVTFKTLRRKPLPMSPLVNVLKEDSQWILGKKPE